MKLSNAIREGGKRYPITAVQCIYDHDTSGYDPLGAAMKVLGIEIGYGYDHWQRLDALYPALNQKWRNPDTGSAYNDLWFTICWLYDVNQRDCDWLANWLESEGL